MSDLLSNKKNNGETTGNLSQNAQMEATVTSPPATTAVTSPLVSMSPQIKIPNFYIAQNDPDWALLATSDDFCERVTYLTKKR